MSPRMHTPQDKWDILLEALGSAHGPDEVCVRRGISLSELRRWLALAREGALQRLTAADAAAAQASAGQTLSGQAPAAQVPSAQVPSASLSGSMGTSTGAAAAAAPRPMVSKYASIPSGVAESGPSPSAPAVSAERLEALQTASATAAIATAAAAVMSATTRPAATDADQSRQAAAPAVANSANEDIDATFSMASHELKEPLRGIKAISQFMREDCGDTLTERGLTYLDTLASTADRMQRLVDGLSDYGRAAQSCRERRSVPLSQLLEQVRTELQDYLGKRQGVVLVDSRLPTIHGNAVALGRAFRHIIHNGIKFNASGTPRVEVVSTQSESGDALCTIVVRDNGIGIDARHLGRIFELFHRLHRYDDYPGAGIGLALARRVIETHGGTINVESTPGQGTSFRIRLPVG